MLVNVFLGLATLAAFLFLVFAGRIHSGKKRNVSDCPFPAGDEGPDLRMDRVIGADRMVGPRPDTLRKEALVDQLLNLRKPWVEPKCVGSLDVVLHQNRLHFVWKTTEPVQQVALFVLEFPPASEPPSCRLRQEKPQAPAEEGGQELPEGHGDHRTAGVL